MSDKKSTYQELENQIVELKKAQLDATVDKDNQYKMLFDSMTEMVQTIELIYDTQGRPVDCYIRDANLAFVNAFGRTKDELINKKSTAIFGVVEENWLTSFASVDKTGTPTSFENYGALFDTYYYVSVWKISENRLGVSYTDITEQKRSENKLLLAEESSRVYFKELPTPMVIYRLEKDDRLVIVQANLNIANVLGLHPGSMVGKSYLEVFPSKKNSNAYNMLHSVAQGELQSSQFIDHYKDKDVSVWSQVTFFNMGEHMVGAISFDISEQKNTEEAFKESKEKRTKELSIANKELTYQNEEKEKRANELVQTKDLLDEAEDLAHMGSFEVNLNTFESKRSKGLKKLFGLRHNEEISNFRSWLERVHPDERVKEQEIIKKFKQGRKYQKWERRFVKFDGEERIFQTRARMFKDGAGIPEKIIGINLDVTETRMNERLQLEAVIKAQEDLRHQLALEIHDGLGPMVAGSKLFLEKIADKIDEKILPEYTENLETLADVHKGLRDLSHRLVPKSLYDFGLAVGIEALCDKMEDASNLEINFRNEGENSLLKGDFALNLYRIAQELMSNVIKHAKASKVNIELISRKKTLTLLVQDNGVGTTKNEEDTQGIGMLNVQSRVKIMNGKLRIESSSGFGTKVTIKVPLK